MGNISFRGSARRKGFSPVQVPNYSQKILAESERTIRGMRDVQQQDIRNRDEYLSTLKDNQRKQQFQDNKNEDLRETFARSYLDAELQHLKTKVKDYSPSGAHAINQKARQDLMALIPKAISTYSAFDKQMMEGAVRKSQDMNSLHYFRDPKEIEAARLYGKGNQWADKAFNEVLQRAKDASPQVQDYLRTLSGRDLQATQQLMLTNHAKVGYPSWLAGDGAFIEDPETGFTWDYFKSNPNSVKARQHLRFLTGRYKQEVLRPQDDGYPGASMNAVSHHMSPWMEQHNDSLITHQLTGEEGAFKEKANKNAYTKLNDSILSWGGKFSAPDLVDHVYAQAGGNTGLIEEEWSKAAHGINGGLASGEIPYDLYHKMANTEVDIGGVVKPLRAHRPNEFAKFDKTIRARQKQVKEARETSTQNFGFSLNQSSIGTVAQMGRPLNQQEVKEIKEVVVARGYDLNHKAFSWLTDYENAEELELSAQKDHLDGLIKEKGGLTMHQLYSLPNYHPSVLEEYAKKTIDGSHSIPKPSRTRLTNSVVQAIAAKMDESGIPKSSDQRRAQTEIMSAIAIAELHENANAAIASGAYKTPLLAWTAAAHDLGKNIKDGIGDYAVNLNANGTVDLTDNPGFKFLGKLSIDVQGLEYKKKALEDRNFIKLSADEGGVSREFVQEIQKIPLTGKYPSVVYKIKQAYPNKTVTEIANDILVANKLDPIEPKGLSRVERYVHPAVKQLITKYPSLARVNRAVETTTKLMNPEVDPKEVELEMTKSPAAVAVDETYGGHDAITAPNISFTTTGTAMFGKPITEVTTGEVSELQSQGRLNEVGAFGIDPKTLKYYIDVGLVDPEVPFDEVTQRTIALENNMDLAGTFFADADSLEPIYGMGQRWYTEDSQLMTPISGLGPLAVEALRLSAKQVGKGFAMAGETIKEEVLDPVGEGLEIASEFEVERKRKAGEKAIESYQQNIYDPAMAITKSVRSQFEKLANFEVERKRKAGEKSIESYKKNIVEPVTAGVENVEEALKQYISMKQQLAGQGFDVYKFRPEVEGELMNHTIKNYFEVE